MASSITGVGTVLRAIGKARKEGAIKISEGLKKCAESVLKKSQKYVPRDTNALAESGQVNGEGTGLGAKYRVAYGGPSAPYALYVHEDLEAKHDPPTCAKFLERAARELRGTMSNIMKREIKDQPIYVIDDEEVE